MGKRLVLSALASALVLSLAACQGADLPDVADGAFDVTVQNVIQGEPTVVAGDNMLTVRWPQNARRVGLQLSWKARAGATSYTVYRVDPDNAGYQLLGSTTDTSFLDRQVQSASLYYYQVVAVTGSAQVTSTLAHAYTLDVNNDIDGFNVYRSRTKDGPYYQVNPETIIGDFFEDHDLPADSTYFYKVSLVIKGTPANIKTDEDLGLGEVSLYLTKWGKTKPAKHQQLKLAIHPCLHSSNNQVARFVVRVTNQKGDIVRNLWRNDFSAKINGRNARVAMAVPVFPVGIQNASLVMDYSGSMYATKRDIPLMERALISGLVGTKGFLDKFEIIKYDTKIINYSGGFVMSLWKLITSVRVLRDKFGGATAFYDALTLAVRNTARQKLPFSSGNVFNKKYVVGWTDGEENSSKMKSDELIRFVRASCVPIFNVGYDGNAQSKGVKNLVSLSDGTGGVTFLANNRSTGLFEKISTVVDNGYVLSVYKPSGRTATYKVTLTAKVKNLTATQTASFTF